MPTISVSKLIAAAALVCLVLSPGAAESTAQSAEKYAVSAIPAALLPADAVVREATARLIIDDTQRSTYDVTYAVTIFSRNEQELGVLTLPYGSTMTVEDLEGTLYDAAGVEIRELSAHDVKDYSAVDDDLLSGNWRIRSAALVHDALPYTVVYRYTEKCNSPLRWPEWSARSNRFPVEHTSFTVIAPNVLPLRSWCSMMDCTPTVTDDGSTTTRTWSREMLPAFTNEEAAEAPEERAAVVRIAPSRFQAADREGSMTSWKEFGAWFMHLFTGKQSLPAEAVRELHALTKRDRSEREKIKSVYEYMQRRTRYVSLQFGVGAWKALDASYVHARGYGDAKALANYTSALLGAVGIDSHPVLIRRGGSRASTIVEFPSSQFNHVILCVPQPRDTVWLECSSQSMPFGFLGEENEDRPALLVSEAGGTVVHTPASRPEENVQARTVKAAAALTGTITAEIITRLSGNRQLDVRRAVEHAAPEERQEWYRESLEIPNVSLSAFSIDGLEPRSTETTVRAAAVLDRAGSFVSSRLFLNPSLLARCTSVPAEDPAGRWPVRFAYPCIDIDSVSIRVPEQFTIETLPMDAVVHASFGSFSRRTIASGDTAVVYIRRTEIRAATIPAERYREYRMFYREIVKADRAQVVLRQKK